MGEKMSLQQVRDWHREEACSFSDEKCKSHTAMADAIDAHLTQPAQAVDVGAIREIADALKANAHDADRNEESNLAAHLRYCADKLTRAISGEKAGPVGDGLPDENWFADQLCDLRNRWGEHEPSWLPHAGQGGGMNADARKALGRVLLGCDPKHVDDLVTVVFALRDQEADIARLNAECRQRMLQAMENGQSAHRQRVRAEKAEALLREAHPFVPITYSSTGQPQLHARITAHLFGE